jgi:hypothetical protein
MTFSNRYHEVRDRRGNPAQRFSLSKVTRYCRFSATQLLLGSAAPRAGSASATQAGLGNEFATLQVTRVANQVLTATLTLPLTLSANDV